MVSDPGSIKISAESMRNLPHLATQQRKAFTMQGVPKHGNRKETSTLWCKKRPKGTPESTPLGVFADVSFPSLGGRKMALAITCAS